MLTTNDVVGDPLVVFPFFLRAARLQPTSSNHRAPLRYWRWPVAQLYDPIHPRPICKQPNDNDSWCDDCIDKMAFTLVRRYEADIRGKPGAAQGRSQRVVHIIFRGR